MASVCSQHIDKVISVGLTAPPAGPAGSPGALFHKSWTRCIKQHGLDPTRPTPARILPQHQVREHQQRMDGFLRVARAGMEDMYRRVADLGYMLLLTDADGITVDYIGNPASEQQLKSAGLYLGADWNEARAGTCGVGTCLIEQTTITCHQAEHFDATHIALTCTSAPLFAPEGQLLGVLDVSALHSPEARESQHLVLQLAAIYAQRIEDANFLRCFERHAILRLGTAPGLVEVAGDLMFALDDEGGIVGANSGARRCLGGPRAVDVRGSALLGQTLQELLGIDMETLQSIARGGPAAAETIAGFGTRRHERFYPALIAPRRGGVALAAAGRPAAITAPGAGSAAAHAMPTAAAASAAAPRCDAAIRPAACGPTPDCSQCGLDRLLGGDAVMQGLVGQCKRLVDKDVNLLICGETGSGKEVLARALHGYSRRAVQPFVAVNCAAIPESLIESELFGYTAGSFTGGKSKGMKGLIAQSDGGTLFLDEIGDMPLQLQTRFLRVLSESEVLPLGAERPVAVKLCVIAATHRDLRERVAAGSFREDLYYRLCGAALCLPPLRERADKRYLIDTLFAEEAQRLGLQSALQPEALALLLQHRWPGNIRELRNALRFALALSGERPVEATDLPPALQPQPAPSASAAAAAWRPAEPPLRAAGADSAAAAASPQAQHLLQALKAHRWSISATARTLGLCRATIYRQMARHGITPPNLQ